MSDLFAARGPTAEIETGELFAPLFDEAGLVPAVVTDAATGAVLMLAWMSAAAVEATVRTGYATFWSRSRRKLWVKGEESGNRLAVEEIRTDCDQDALLIVARIEGGGVACHTGARSCFYRALDRAHASARPLRLKRVDR